MKKHYRAILKAVQDCRAELGSFKKKKKKHKLRLQKELRQEESTCPEWRAVKTLRLCPTWQTLDISSDFDNNLVPLR